MHGLRRAYDEPLEPRWEKSSGDGDLWRDKGGEKLAEDDAREKLGVDERDDIRYL